jgi:hypothetical protein
MADDKQYHPVIEGMKLVGKGIAYTVGSCWKYGVIPMFKGIAWASNKSFEISAKELSKLEEKAKASKQQAKEKAMKERMAAMYGLSLEDFEALRQMPGGDQILLENLRRVQQIPSPEDPRIDRQERMLERLITALTTQRGVIAYNPAGSTYVERAINEDLAYRLYSDAFKIATARA